MYFTQDQLSRMAWLDEENAKPISEPASTIWGDIPIGEWSDQNFTESTETVATAWGTFPVGGGF